MPLVEQELLILAEHPSSPPVSSGIRVTRSLVLCVCIVDRCLSFVLFLLAIVLSVVLRCTDSDYLPLVSSNSSQSIDCPSVSTMFSLDFGIAPTVGISSFIILTISIKKKNPSLGEAGHGARGLSLRDTGYGVRGISLRGKGHGARGLSLGEAGHGARSLSLRVTGYGTLGISLRETGHGARGLSLGRRDMRPVV